MKIISKYDAYLKDADTDLESDEFTRGLIKQYYEEEALKTHWKSLLEKDYRYPPKASPIVKRPVVAIGVIMTIAACLLFFWMMPTQPDGLNQSPVKQLLSEHYAKPYTRDLLKGPSSNPDARSLAYEFYQKKKYEKAIPLLEQAIGNGSAEESDHFFLGLTYLYGGYSKKANEQFKYILAQPHTRYEDAAIWYLALGLTDAGDYEQARIYLKQVAQWNGNSGKLKMAAEAEKLLELIDD